MAETINTDIESVAKDELNLDEKVTVRSIAGWDTGFRRNDGTGDVKITANGTIRLTRNEIISQVQGGNTLFTGVDGRGSHATLYIEDAATRKEVDFESEDGVTQQFLSDDTVKKVFAMKSQGEFENAFKTAVRTRAEKYTVMQIIKKLGINSYSKIRFAEDYTGFRLQ